VAGATLSAALPRLHDVSVLSWDRGDVLTVPTEATDAVLEAGRRATDLVVVDLSRFLDDAGRIVLALAGQVLLVVPAEVRAVAAAGRVATQLAPLAHDLRLVVRAPGRGGLTAEAVVRALQLPLAGVLRPEPGLDLALERGEPPGRRARSPLSACATALLDDLLPLERRAA
jgi:secretion/DNA translocation related CpaE-like protein